MHWSPVNVGVDQQMKVKATLPYILQTPLKYEKERNILSTSTQHFGYDYLGLLSGVTFGWLPQTFDQFGIRQHHLAIY